MIDFDELDFSSFCDVPAPVRYYERLRLSVNSDGKVSMNTAFVKQLGDLREFRFQISKERRYLLLKPTEKGNVHFSPRVVLPMRRWRSF